MTLALSSPPIEQAPRNRARVAIEQKAALTPLSESRLRRRLRQIAPSEPWVDVQITTRDDPAEGGRLIARRYFTPDQFPPGGRARTAMRWCRNCGRYTPPYALRLIEHLPTPGGSPITASLLCDDCHIAHDAQQHQELHDALPHLRPVGSFSFFHMADLFATRKSAR